ncbi:MAG: UDP-N-acetylmuramoyl-L-alanine--D-glutamate ligase [Fimbriimonadaceae bacterium]|jgi:UDP-N-acetylmuramoylalanine--D-glutamate ligase|nr:UDP-N-acetylmuramoyl-L-alanine--D-glutamate ligase [Fimbriimonadaceae bacterium]
MAREEFLGKRVAVAGMGVSGRAVAVTLKELGANPVVFDQKLGDVPEVLAATDQLVALEIEAVTGWHGHLDPDEFDALIVSPGFRRDHLAIQDMAEKEVMSEVEFASRLTDRPILAITGTNGKSTTTVMLWTILKGGGHDALLCGNIAGSGYPEMTLTRAAMEAGPESVLVAEVSSYQLEFVTKFRPKVAACTNVTPDHMDRHPDFDDYFQTKMRLFGQMGEGDAVVINLDEPSLQVTDLRKPLTNSATIVQFSPQGKSVGENGVTRRKGNSVVLSGETVGLEEFPFFGEHNFSNALMAWEMASCYSRPTIGCLDALRSFRGLSNRMEFLGVRDGIWVFNNSMCTNPAAVIASSRSLPRRQTLLMGGNTKNLDFDPVADYLSRSSHRVVLFGLDGEKLNGMLGGAWPIYPTLASAFDAAVSQSAKEEAILLSPGCASSEPYVNFKERGDAFRKIARDWLDT